MRGRKPLLKHVLPCISVLLLAALMLSIGCSAPALESPSYQSPSAPSTSRPPAPPTDPAATTPNFATDSGKGSVGSPPQGPSPRQVTPYNSGARSSESIGLATGGAKDINNFRENINNRFLPLPTDITCEGLYYDYYFDTGQQRACNRLFCPSYSYAVTRDPFSHKTEYYFSVGLNSGMKERDFERKKLNLAIVLDMSGSMASPFDQYYYDGAGRRVALDWNERSLTKIEVAKEAVRSILDQLNEDDRFGIVLFNDHASVLQKPVYGGDMDGDRLADSINRIKATGGTNLADGMKLGTDMLNKYRESDASEYENRIIFLTDAMPNLGETGEYSLLNQLKKNAGNMVYTTFIGIGVDFNSELVEFITKTKGANYYSVHSPSQFRERVDEEFDFMVTPLVFNLELKLDSPGWDIDTVYGSPEADKSTGEIMKVNTLFPSKKEDGETKGGLILLKLKKRGMGSDEIRLKVSYEDREGRRDTSESMVYLEGSRPEYFDNSGIRKGVLLARYTNLVKDWIIDERQHAHISFPWKPRVNADDGICLPPTSLGTWERQSMQLSVPSEYRSLFRDFAEYFSSEMDQIGDTSLEQELVILDRLAGHGD